ncbi:hypothetical protein Tco_0040350, partial [Tanacetum coccineum]
VEEGTKLYPVGSWDRAEAANTVVPILHLLDLVNLVEGQLSSVEDVLGTKGAYESHE